MYTAVYSYCLSGTLRVLGTFRDTNVGKSNSKRPLMEKTLFQMTILLPEE
jgi:hypothetical protein